MFCTQCGTPLKENQKFCTNCGSRPEAEVTVLPRATSQPSRSAIPMAGASRVPVSTSSSAPAIEVTPTQPPPSAAAVEAPRPVAVAAPAAPTMASGAGEFEKSAGSPNAVRRFLPWVLAALGIVVVAGVFLYHRFSTSTPSVSDADIIHSIQTRFAADPDLSKCTVEVKSQNGVVTLTGLVNRESDKTIAASTAGQQPGVKQVNVYGLVMSTPIPPSTGGETDDSNSVTSESQTASAGGHAVVPAPTVKEEPTPVFVSILAPGTRTFTSGFSAKGNFFLAGDRIFLQSQATASLSFSVPEGQTRTVVYGIPAEGFLNNAPVEIWVNEAKVTTIAENLGGLGAKTPSTLQLWHKAFGPGNYIITLKSLGRSVNVYGFWFDTPPGLNQGAGAGGAPSPEQGVGGLRTTITVPADQAWTATGIFLNTGALVTLSATGTASMGGGWPPMPPEGKPPDCGGRGGFPAGQLPCWSLIGRVGEQGPIFYVGSGTSLRVPKEGQLFLGVNDDQIEDNSGNWIATVAVRTNPPSTSTAQATWLGFANGNVAQDRDVELRRNCGDFGRVNVPDKAGNKFTDLCGYIRKTCEKVCDWQGSTLSCDVISQGGNRDGTRVAFCR